MPMVHGLQSIKENGLIYTGKLINYTVDPADELKEVLLSNYRLAVRREGIIRKPEEFCTIIEDHTNDPDTRIYLNQNSIIAIQIQE